MGAHNPALRGDGNGKSPTSTSRDGKAGKGSSSSFEAMWGYSGSKDLGWVWDGIRGKATSRLLLLLFEHCFHSPFLSTSLLLPDSGGSRVNEKGSGSGSGSGEACGNKRR